jgi:CII-binding regulator of phage lambda lysogenization HflD
MENLMPTIEITVVQQWLGLIIAGASVIAIIGGLFRWIIKNYLNQIRHELQPNSGVSIKDQVTRLETSQIKIHEELESTKNNLNEKLDKTQQNFNEKIDKHNKEIHDSIESIYKLIIEKL